MMVKEFAAVLRPAAELMLSKNLSYMDAERAFRLVYCIVAHEKFGPKQKDAAAKIQMSDGYFTKVIAGHRKKRQVNKGRKSNLSRQGSPAEVIGAIEI
jgi:hypothetical protein